MLYRVKYPGETLFIPINPGVALIEPLRVLFLAAEADPFIKIGGLGDVAGSLSHALRNLSDPAFPFEVDLRLVLPYHGVIHGMGLSLHKEATFSIPLVSSEHLVVVVFSTASGDLPVYFISGGVIPNNSPVYTSDLTADGRKFAFFSLAALELARKFNWSPHIVHANDWHTALAVYALSRWRAEDTFFQATFSIFVLHNLPYMGVGMDKVLTEFKLTPSDNTDLPTWARDIPLALALSTADPIVTVSPAFAREILTREFGSGLHKFLRTRRKRISGILNGLDIQYWNPLTDPIIKKNYDKHTLADRLVNGLALQKEFGLEQNYDLLLMSMVSRMDRQKGVDLIPEALRLLNRTKSSRIFQAIILGTGDKKLEQEVLNLESEFPDRVKVAVRFDEDLSHRIFAGADLLLVPSRYEPCGLTQMIAMRYGCIPVGRQTGGLQDTIQDYDHTKNSTGFLFMQPSPHAPEKALRRAINLYRNDPQEWQELQKRGMSRDFSWHTSAKQYLKLYLDLASAVEPEYSN
jgi:starch synthase